MRKEGETAGVGDAFKGYVAWAPVREMGDASKMDTSRAMRTKSRRKCDGMVVG